MMPPDLSSKSSRQDLRKAVLRMRLEMHRQELRHETLQIIQPLRQARDVGRSLRNHSAPIWLTGGALALAGLIGGKRGWRRWLRLALVVAPLLSRRAGGSPSSPRGPLDAEKHS